MLLNCGVGEDSWESLGLQGDPTSPSKWKSVLNIHWKDWCWSLSSSTLATWCELLTHLKRPWCWERLKAGEEDKRGWDGWMASLTLWTWVWANSGSWWWTGKPGGLHPMGSQRIGHDWATELNWKFLKTYFTKHLFLIVFHEIGFKEADTVWFYNPLRRYHTLGAKRKPGCKIKKNRRGEIFLEWEYVLCCA